MKIEEIFEEDCEQYWTKIRLYKHSWQYTVVKMRSKENNIALLKWSFFIT